MKKIFSMFVLFILTSGMTFAVDRYSQEYLKNTKHFSPMNSIAESIAEHCIKSSLKKEAKGKFKVDFQGYTLSSMKKGIFKGLEITGEKLTVEGISIPYVHLKSLSDYNYVDYTQDPVVYKSDMEFAYDLILSEESMNTALKRKEYEKVLGVVNNIAYPLFQITGVSTKIRNNRIYILTEYNFPIAPASKNKVFVASSDFKIQNEKIRAVNVKLDSAYGNISLEKVANLFNLLNPLEFTLETLDTQECDANIENVNIVDNKVKINGKIFVKGEQK